MYLPPQASRTARWLYAACALLVASVGGFLAGWTPELTGVLVVGGMLLVLLLAQVELAALAVVAASIFEGYLEVVAQSASTGLTLVVVGAWAIRRSRGRMHHGRRSPVLLAALGLTVALLVSTLVHNLGSTSASVLGRWAGLLALLVVLTDCMRERLRPEQVARVYVAACAVASLSGLAAYLVVDDRSVSGPVGDPDRFAFYLLAAIPLGLGVRRLGRRAWPWDLAVGLTALALLATLSRGAVLGLVVSLLFAVVARQVSLRAVALLLVAVLTAGSLTVSLRPELLHTSLHGRSAVTNPDVSERLDLWQAAARMAVDSPLVGQGPGSFAAEHVQYLSRLPDSAELYPVAHSTYLEIVAENGLLGVTAFLVLLATGFVGAWLWWRRTRSPLAAGVTSALVGTALAASMVTGQFDLPLWLLCAMGAALGHVADQTGRAEPSRGDRR